MIIDVHVHPVLFGPICTDSDQGEFQKEGVWPVQIISCAHGAGHGCDGSCRSGSGGNSCGRLFCIDGTADCVKRRSKEDRRIVSGTLYRLCQCRSARGMCGRKTKDAFEKLNLMGLKLNLSHLNMYPDDRRLKPLLDLCTKYDKPVAVSQRLQLGTRIPRQNIHVRFCLKISPWNIRRFGSACRIWDGPGWMSCACCC